MKTRSTLFDSIKGIAILGIMFIHLGQWNLDLDEGSRLSIIRSAGLLGVELTFLVNAYFLAKHYDEYSLENWGGYLLKCVINLVPIYWFGLTIYMISSLLLGIDLKCGMINIISHYLLLNGLLPQWFGGFMGGTGYFGILILMWILFPIYLKRIKNLTDSVLYGIIAIACSLTIMVILRGLNAALGFDNSGNFDDWVWYLNRGIYSYALGGVLYYWLKEKEVVLSTRLAKVVGYALLIIIIVKAVLYGSKFDGIFFLALWIGFVILGHKVKFFLVDNSLFAWLGKHITELFVAHIVLYYLLVLNYRIVQPGYKTMLILFALSFSTAPLLKKFITEPFKSLNMKLIHFRED